MMKMLINAGASLHLQDHKGNTPLHIACQYKYTACLDVLLSTLDHRTLSDLAEIRNYEGNSCIHLAAYAENVEGLLKLCEAGVPVDIKVREGLDRGSIGYHSLGIFLWEWSPFVWVTTACVYNMLTKFIIISFSLSMLF